MTRYSPYRRHCQELGCNKKLSRDEVLYNGGYCDDCLAENVRRGQREKAASKVVRPRHEQVR